MILPVPGIVEYRDHHLVMICVATKPKISTIVTVSGSLEKANDIASNVLNNTTIELTYSTDETDHCLLFLLHIQSKFVNESQRIEQ